MDFDNGGRAYKRLAQVVKGRPAEGLIVCSKSYDTVKYC